MNFVREGILSLVVVTIFLSVPNIVFATEPIVTSFTIQNIDNSDPIYSNGDKLIITFDRTTNTPGGTGIQDKAAVVALFDIGDDPGSNYVGQWTNNNVFVITLIDITGNDIIIGSSTADPSIISIHELGFPLDIWVTLSPPLELFISQSGESCDGECQAPELLIEKTIAQVIDMINEDKLNEGQATSLIEKLEAAVKKLEAGKDKPAYNMLQSFINHIEAFIKSGVLTSEQGQPLIDSARAVQDGLY